MEKGCPLGAATTFDRMGAPDAPPEMPHVRVAETRLPHLAVFVSFGRAVQDVHSGHMGDPVSTHRRNDLC